MFVRHERFAKQRMNPCTSNKHTHTCSVLRRDTAFRELASRRDAYRGDSLAMEGSGSDPPLGSDPPGPPEDADMPPRPPADADIEYWLLHNAPPRLTCPLSHQLVRDAVRFRNAQADPIMSREFIEPWLRKWGTSPFSREQNPADR